MNKKIFRRFLVFVTFILFLFVCPTLFAQTPTPAPSPSATIQPIDYSESVPYVPRVFKAPSSSTTVNTQTTDNKKPVTEPPKPVSTTIRNVIRSGESFTFPVSVFDSADSIILGATKSNFRVFIGDEEQEITNVETNTRPLNVVLMLDLSPSASYRQETIKKITSEIAQKLRPGDKIMVVQFDEKLKVLTDFTTDRKAVTHAIEKSEGGDGTSLYESIEEVFDNKLAMIDGPSSIVLLTDGIDTTSRKTGYIHSLIEAEKGNANVFPIYFDTVDDQKKTSSGSRLGSGSGGILAAILAGQPGNIGRPRSDKEIREERDRGIAYLNDLVQLSGGRALPSPSASKKMPISTLVAGWLTHQYFLTINPKIPPNPGERLPFRVRVNRPGLAVIVKASYYAGN